MQANDAVNADTARTALFGRQMETKKQQEEESTYICTGDPA